MENLGKRAQAIKETRANKIDEEARNRLNNLSRYSNLIEENFSKIREMIRNKTKKNERKQTITSLIEEINQYISKIENGLIELKTLDNEKALVAEPHYQQKIVNWRNQLNNIDVLIVTPNKNKSRISSETLNQINITSQDTNPDELKVKLTNIGTIIDADIKSICSGNKKIKPALSSFESGLAMLKAINPQDPIIAYFDNKLQEWKAKVKQARISKIAIIVSIILLLILSDYM